MFARCRRISGPEVSATRPSMVGSHLVITSGGPEELTSSGISNQSPWRNERAEVAPANAKWTPGGRCLMPRKRGDVVNERRSMPPRAPCGRSRSRIAGVVAVSISGLRKPLCAGEAKPIAVSKSRSHAAASQGYRIQYGEGLCAWKCVRGSAGISGNTAPSTSSKQIR